MRLCATLLSVLSWMSLPGCRSVSEEPAVPDVDASAPVSSAAATDAPAEVSSDTRAARDDSDSAVVNQIDTVRPQATMKPDPLVPLPVFPPPAAGVMVDVPAGVFLRGSAPQDSLRDQFAENDLVSTPMTAFQIDVLPWPNDPAAEFVTNVSRIEAGELCTSVGKRLCTEVELEYACRGTDNRRYPSGNSYNEAMYVDPVSPASPFGVYAFGRIIEWTASPWGENVDQVERAAVRGWAEGATTLGQPVSPRQGRRCAKRWNRLPTGAYPEVGFRCCSGPANKELCTIEAPRPAHSLYTNIKPDKFARIIGMVPELSMIHDNPHMFSDGDVRTVLARRSSNRQELARGGIHFHWKPLRWIPRQGTELWVAVGRSNRHAFIVALHETVDNEEYVHGSSLILWDTPSPIALAWREGHRDQVFWAPCWGCRDGGTIEWDDARNEVIITHRW